MNNGENMRIDEFVAQPVDISGKTVVAMNGQVIVANEGTKVTLLDLLEMQRRAQVGIQALNAALADIGKILNDFDVPMGEQVDE